MINRRTMIISQWIRVVALIIFLVVTGLKQWWLPFGAAALFLAISIYMLFSAYRRSAE